MHSDDELYRAYLRGDTPAYDELMIRYGDSLTFFLNGYLHDPDDAEDLMVEAFARIMAARPHIREGGFKAYLYKTARNLASRFSRSRKRMQTFSLEECDVDALPDPYLPEKKILNGERRAALRLCMERIGPDMREALYLVYLEGLSYAEAADVLHVGRKKIDNLLARGKQALREELAKEGITNAYE
ncbi:MAG: RNA polymerase sigma factor [Lachnospiraceae bacterium]|nr:RNA polymerase sigma factor [Lachnospiraceae bacterium]